MDKYEFLDHIGEGKFGHVFKARNKKTSSYVAVKQNTGAFNMLRREATILNFLQQKGVRNIPRILYYGKHEDIFYLIIPFYTCDLYDYIENKRPSLQHIQLIIYKCIDVLQHIHYHDIAHCDIKPQNFMIHNGEVILIDFGLANYITLLDKKTEHVIGSPRFMSFFVHNGESYAYRDDLISLGYMYILFMKRELLWDDIPHCECGYERTHILHVDNIYRKRLKSLENVIQYAPTLCAFFTYMYNVDGFPDYEKIHELLC